MTSYTKFLFALCLVVASSQIARSEVVEIHDELNPSGPKCHPTFGCTLRVQIRGEITDATVDQLNRIIDSTRRKAEADKLFFSFMSADLNSRGGSVNAAMAIGRILRKDEAGAFVSRGAVCLSSCVLILAGGSFRSFEGQIGIHRPYLPVPSGDVSPEIVKATYQKMLQDLRAYFREMNVVDGLADAMLRINPENVRLLNKEELTSYGLTDVDPIAQEAQELQMAKSNGLNREEFMHRKSLAEERCGGPASMGSDCYRSILKYGR